MRSSHWPAPLCHSPLLFLATAAAAVVLFSGCLSSAHSCPFSSQDSDLGLHEHDHDHDHLHLRHHDHHEHRDVEIRQRKRLPEEMAEEEDLKLEGFGHHHHHHHHHHSHDEELDLEMTSLGIWVQSMGCSLLVSLASLVCLILLPVFFFQGKPSKTLVDALAVFGAGAMLGDAFLHQLPHAFGGEHSHSHDHHSIDLHDHVEHGHSHSHSLEDLSVGLSVLSGIVLFLLVEKLVRYIEEFSGERNGLHHHHHRQHQKVKHDDNDQGDNANSVDNDMKENGKLDTTAKRKLVDGQWDDKMSDKYNEHETQLRKRTTPGNATKAEYSDADNHPVTENLSIKEKASSSSASNLVFGYLNLFSDGVHNFTDGMALGSAFLLYGPVGGWSRTLFLLAHELPQEIGDFGILVRSGFTVSKALFFNFLSALTALAGTALALILGKDPGQSSLIEGFTAGGFIYIAVAGVLPEMNAGSTTLKSTLIQLTALVLGMSVALCISLVE
ncbi:Zinc/iron permease protein [Dioscorea alata]|uniref:Zinc/iron permease protein n=2 Tax=Dioscorea alata TaxID=55571 RepID=A0ACB7U6Z7_DIOAL|nr:Zinc/iron permease protein [Dioscorea alata]KAH7656104.1 Zinc/iron permease protein [Dioscorea alata]